MRNLPAEEMENLLKPDADIAATLIARLATCHFEERLSKYKFECY